MGKAGKSVNNLTEGPITKKLILFALPFLGSSLIQQLYNTVDLMFVGKLLGKEAAAAVGAGSLLITLVLGLFTGLSVGIGVVAAGAFGAGDTDKLRRVIRTAGGITLFGGLIMIAFGVTCAPVFLRWMNTPEDVMDMATVYIRIYFLSLISIIGYNMSSGILRALGNSKSPMLYQLAGGIANVFGNALFIGLLKWGVKGAAAATFLSQTVAAAITIYRLTRLDESYRLRLRNIGIDFSMCRQIFSVGLPAAVQAMVITFSNVIVQSNINSLGVDSIAAFTAYFKVENFVYLPIMAFGQANTTFTGQNVGARKLDRAKKGVLVTIGLGVAVTVILSTVLLLLNKPVFGLFTNNAEIVELGYSIARITFPLYFIYVFLEVFASAIRGAGKALPPMIIILVNMCLVRIGILQLVMHIKPEVSGVAIIYPITWLITAICLGVYYKFGHWQPRTV